MSLISSYLFALFLTIAIELVVAFLLDFKKKLEIVTIVFINSLTNPTLNYLLLVNDYFSFFDTNLLIILLLELMVVLIEWRLLFWVLREKTKKLLLLSLVMNFCSYIVGVIMFR